MQNVKRVKEVFFEGVWEKVVRRVEKRRPTC
jgi:hypothetical protein